jgi:hypothetical protein
MQILHIIIWQKFYVDNILGRLVHSDLALAKIDTIEKALNLKNCIHNSWLKCLRQLIFCV